MVNKHSDNAPKPVDGDPTQVQVSELRQRGRHLPQHHALDCDAHLHSSSWGLDAQGRQAREFAHGATVGVEAGGQCVQRGLISGWSREHEDNANPAATITLNCPSSTCHAGRQAQGSREPGKSHEYAVRK